jgi:Lrp/AsnC family transcriptional regulator, leucine-responsive regulatory protein
MIQLDSIDRQILEILQREGRLTNAELARRVGLTPPPTLERVKRLEREGVIRGYAAIVDPAALEQRFLVFAAVSLTMHQGAAVEAFTEAVRALPGVQECHHLTGEADYLLKVLVRDVAGYERFLREQLLRLPGVQRVQTSVVLSTVKQDTYVHVPPLEPT